MIARSYHPQKRVFPVISENLYKLSFEQAELTADKQAAYNLLALANQTFFGSHLDVLGQFGSLLRQHQLAMEAELASKWLRADFFWRQVQIEFEALSKKQAVWQELAVAVASHPETKLMNNPVQLRQRLLDELFIDTHCAFYNGLIPKTTKPSWKERAFVHINYIQQLLELSSISKEEIQTLLREAWQRQIDACKEAKKRQLAMNYCQAILKCLPNDIQFQGELVEIHYLATLAKCREDAKTRAQHHQNAKTLHRRIQELEKYLKQYPYNQIIFQLLSSLYHLRAVSLKHNDQLSESLLCVQKAIAHNPLEPKVYKTRHELMEMMTQRQEQMNQLLVDMRHGVPVNPKERQWQVEVKKGFAPMNNYIDSDEAKKTATAFQTAQAVYLWHRIGLPKPDDNWAESAAGVMHTPDGKTKPIQSTSKSTTTALQLWETVNSILKHPPKTKAEVPSVWEKVVESKPYLAVLNAVRICGYIEHSLFGEGENRVLITPLTGHSELLPILKPTSTQPQMSTEPFIRWLFSSQDKRIKLQAVVASVLIIATGCIAIREKTTFEERENAYQTILAAKQVQNDEAVLKASGEFFNHVSLLAKDERSPQVIEIYEESLVRWFAQQPEAQLKQADQEYLELYKQLQKTAIAQEKQP